MVAVSRQRNEMAQPRPCHRRQRRARAAQIDLYDYARLPAPLLGRPASDLTNWRVVDDWPERVPITEREVDVFEAWLGDVLDELFGPV